VQTNQKIKLTLLFKKLIISSFIYKKGKKKRQLFLEKNHCTKLKNKTQVVCILILFLTQVVAVLKFEKFSYF